MSHPSKKQSGGYDSFFLLLMLLLLVQLRDNKMVRFNDSWFVFHDSSFLEPYFSRKCVFHEYRVNRTQDYGFKTCK